MLLQAVGERNARLRKKPNAPPCNESSFEETIQRLGHYLISHKVIKDTCMTLSSCTDTGVHDTNCRLKAPYQNPQDVRGSQSKRFNASSAAVAPVVLLWRTSA